MGSPLEEVVQQLHHILEGVSKDAAHVAQHVNSWPPLKLLHATTCKHLSASLHQYGKVLISALLPHRVVEQLWQQQLVCLVVPAEGTLGHCAAAQHSCR